jgi:uncharacterized surface protein with fasciclin (FAS1) repeats
MRRTKAFVAIALCFSILASSQVVLAGPPAGKMPIYAMARANGLSTLATAVETAGLQRTLQVDGPWTVFAPTNEAFAALGEETLQAVLADVDLLTDILLYHVAAGELVASSVLASDTIPMANGASVSVDATAVQVNGANIIGTDLMARNGVVHLIDAVLLPPSLSARVEMSKQAATGAPVQEEADQGSSWGAVKDRFHR